MGGEHRSQARLIVARVYSSHQQQRLNGSNMSRHFSTTNSWRRRLFAALLLPAFSVAVTAGTAGFVSSVARASQADYHEGYAAGKQQGHKDGYTDGYKDAYKVSYDEGFKDGLSRYTFSTGAADYRRGYTA